MAQTGLPFGEVNAALNWLNIRGPVGNPVPEHPNRPVDGFSCARSEVSGRRLWGLMEERFGTADTFFADHFVANYCPLSFMTESGRNFTPDKLPSDRREQLFEICDVHLRATVEILEADWVIGIGKFAEKRINVACRKQLEAGLIRSGTVIHPSPASPAANRGWAEAAVKRMQEYGIWS
jgi:single-strand selective monofunctional uracil DNA glycosylase